MLMLNVNLVFAEPVVRVAQLIKKLSIVRTKDLSSCRISFGFLYDKVMLFHQGLQM